MCAEEARLWWSHCSVSSVLQLRQRIIHLESLVHEGKENEARLQAEAESRDQVDDETDTRAG